MTASGNLNCAQAAEGLRLVKPASLAGSDHYEIQGGALVATASQGRAWLRWRLGQAT